MRKSVWPVLLLLALGILFGLVRGITKRPMPDLAHYERVQLGMTIREVQALLGPGRPVTQAEVPCLMELMTLPVAPTERKPAKPLAIRPVVEGDLILQWENERTEGWILVAFRDGRVCAKDRWEPSGP